MLIFINNDLAGNTLSTLMLQLQIDEQIDLTEYNARVAGTPDYDLIVRQNGIRLLVIDTYYNLTIDRDVFDFCLFLKDGKHLCCVVEVMVSPALPFQ